MVIQNRTVITLGEISTLRFTCKHCHSTIGCPPERWEKIALVCPNCEMTWMQGGTAEREALRLLCESLCDARKAEKNVRCDISLELTGCVQLPAQLA